MNNGQGQQQQQQNNHPHTQQQQPVGRFSWVRRFMANRRDELPEYSRLEATSQLSTDSDLSSSIYHYQREDNASTRAMLSDHEDYVDLDVEDNGNYNDNDTISTREDFSDSLSRYPISNKSTAITSMASINVNPLLQSQQQQQQHLNANLLLNPGTASIHSMMTGVTRNDSASVVTIASSTRDWRRRRSIDTNVSTNALPPGSIQNGIA